MIAGDRPPRYGPGRGSPRHVPFGSGCSRTTVSCSSLANRDNRVNPAPAWLGEGQALALRCKGPFFYRSAGALACHTRRRAGFPRARAHAPGSVVRERPLPNGSREGTPARENKPTVVCDLAVSRLGGLSYSKEIKTRRFLLPNASKYETPSDNMITYSVHGCHGGKTI